MNFVISHRTEVHWRMTAKEGAGVWGRIWAPFAGARGLDDEDIVAANARDEPHVIPWLGTKTRYWILERIFEQCFVMINFGAWHRKISYSFSSFFLKKWIEFGVGAKRINAQSVENSKRIHMLHAPLWDVVTWQNRAKQYGATQCGIYTLIKISLRQGEHVIRKSDRLMWTQEGDNCWEWEMSRTGERDSVPEGWARAKITKRDVVRWHSEERIKIANMAYWFYMMGRTTAHHLESICILAILIISSECKRLTFPLVIFALLRPPGMLSRSPVLLDL